MIWLNCSVKFYIREFRKSSIKLREVRANQSGSYSKNKSVPLPLPGRNSQNHFFSPYTILRSFMEKKKQSFNEKLTHNNQCDNAESLIINLKDKTTEKRINLQKMSDHQLQSYLILPKIHKIHNKHSSVDIANNHSILNDNSFVADNIPKRNHSVLYQIR